MRIRLIAAATAIVAIADVQIQAVLLMDAVRVVRVIVAAEALVVQEPTVALSKAE